MDRENIVRGLLQILFGNNKKENISMSEDKVKLNGVEISREQLEEKKKEVAQMKGVRIVEVAPNEFKNKIEG